MPEIDPRQHRLTIYGMVDRPLTLTMEELMRICHRYRAFTLSSATPTARPRTFVRRLGRRPGIVLGSYSCSEWTGVLVSTLLDMVGVQKGAKWFYASAADEYNQTWAIPLWKGMDDAMVAYGQNGEPLRIEQGFPIRLRLPGFQGNDEHQAAAADQGHRRVDSIPPAVRRKCKPRKKNHLVPCEMPPQSCILRPSGGQRLTSRGFHEIRGIAWSGGGKMTKVEVTVDGGKSWKEARLQGPVYSKVRHAVYLALELERARDHHRGAAATMRRAAHNRQHRRP